MSASVTSINDARGRPLTAKERLECLLQAQLNEEKASFCTPDQPALKTFLLLNAALLHKVAAK